MMSRRFQQFILLFLLSGFLAPVSAVRYMGDPKDAPVIKNLITILQVQSQEIEKVLHMLGALQTEKQKLDKRKETLGKAMQTLKADKALLKEGKMSQQDYQHKWQKKGLEQQLNKDIQSFQQTVKKFNRSIRAFNIAATKMKHVLKKRTPGQMVSLVKAMKSLITELQKALDKGNYERALFIARKSEVAREFGYREN